MDDALVHLHRQLDMYIIYECIHMYISNSYRLMDTGQIDRDKPPTPYITHQYVVKFFGLQSRYRSE